MYPEETDSGYCTNCGRAGATVYVGDGVDNKPLFAHVGLCERLSIKRALGQPMIDLTRMKSDQEARDNRG